MHSPNRFEMDDGPESNSNIAQEPREPQAQPGPFAYRDYRLFITQGFLTNIVEKSQTVIIGWDLYERTGSALALGWMGLLQFLPVILLFLPAGQIADRFDRRWVIAISLLGWSASHSILVYASVTGADTTWIYIATVCIGTASVVNRPSRDAIMPQLLPRPILGRAIALNVSVFQTAAITGPALAGAMIAVTHSAATAYAINVACTLVAAVLVLWIGRRSVERLGPSRSLRDLFGGLEHVWRTKEILGVITLDLFAVLFGGATALLPVYAKDILHVGPAGLGWLTAAVSLGALAASVTQGIRRPFRRQGMAFAWSVAGFGVAIIVFGLSSWFWLSLLALIAVGALDNISVVTRQLVVQFYTPDELRGRVSAVNRVFISSSNELGAFESGALAALTGPVFTVVFGGFATIALVAAGMRYFPALRKMGSLAR